LCCGPRDERIAIAQSPTERRSRARQYPDILLAASPDDVGRASETRLAATANALVDDFAQHGHVHEVRVPGVPETLFIVPTTSEGEHLATRKGIARGRIWTARELVDLLEAHARVSPSDFAAIVLAKLAFDGEVVATVRRGM
jgi:hypothetical protein